MAAMPDKELERRRRTRNYALGGVLAALAVLSYLIAFVKFGAG